MVKINIKTNLSFFLILLGVIILSFVEGLAVSQALIKEQIIQGSELQLIAFILIAIFMIAVSTLKPNKLILVAYSSMTLGLIVIITGLFDPSNNAPLSIKVTEVIVGLILILSGFFMGKGLRITEEEQKIVREGLKGYYKKL
mgnify:FL=1